MNRNYVIINGVNSLTIKGLAINLMPPITKPLMRTMREEIDGRNGDINTELGYQAYDKQIEVGLYGNYDIDEIIAFFNSKGTIVFSDENDKFYNFQILDKIDFAKMIKFRTAMINIHCQPFKYPLTDTPVDVAYDYVESTGTNLTIDNTAEAIFNKIELQGNTYQEQTSGKNLYNVGTLTTTTSSGITFTPYYENNQLQYINVNGTATAHVFYNLEKITLPAGSYIITGCTGGGANTYFLGVNFGLGRMSQIDGQYPFTLAEERTMTESFIRIGNGTTVNNQKIYPMIRISSITDSTYEPYTDGASPNPNYPQPVEVVAGDNEITICGMNLFDINGDIDSATSGYQYTIDGTTLIVPSSTGNAGQLVYDKLYNGGTYKLSFTKISGTFRIVLRVYKNGNLVTNQAPTGFSQYNSTYQGYFKDCSSSPVDIIVPSEYMFKIDFVYTNWSAKDIQLEKGSSASSYELYNGETYPLYLGVEDLITNGEVDWNASQHDLNVVSNSLPIGTYTLSTTNIPPTGAFVLYGVDNNNVQETILGNQGWAKAGQTGCTFTSTKIYKKLQIYTNVAVQGNIQLVRGTKINHISSTPIELCKIDEYKDRIFKSSGKNLLDTSELKDVLNENGASRKGFYFQIQKTGTYYVLFQNLNTQNVLYCGKSTNLTQNTTPLSKNSLDHSFTYNFNEGEYFIIWGATDNDANDEIMLTLSSEPIPYEPYGSGKWYIEKNIGKVVLDGSENWQDRPTFNDCDRFVYQIFLTSQAVKGFSNYFRVFTYLTSSVGNLTINAGSQIVVNFSAKGTTTLEQFKTWVSTHNVILYYQLTTPTDIEITNETLIGQLEAIKNAISYKGQTNIIQDNSDKPFMIDATALKKGSDTAVLNNIGNIYSKPVIALKGTGIVNIYNDGVQAFQVDMSEENDITIDTEMMEAYTPTKLANRQVTGDYSKFMIDTGSHNVKFDGELTEATITRYVRWL